MLLPQLGREREQMAHALHLGAQVLFCLLYTSDAADE